MTTCPTIDWTKTKTISQHDSPNNKTIVTFTKPVVMNGVTCQTAIRVLDHDGNAFYTPAMRGTDLVYAQGETENEDQSTLSEAQETVLVLLFESLDFKKAKRDSFDYDGIGWDQDSKGRWWDYYKVLRIAEKFCEKMYDLGVPVPDNYCLKLTDHFRVMRDIKIVAAR